MVFVGSIIALLMNVGKSGLFDAENMLPTAPLVLRSGPVPLAAMGMG